jgi:phosphopantothenoylcysteine decarboxylase/phosphopantothenate--cysteine ligase
MITTPLVQKRIVLGVTGSIAAYKAADLASKLTQAGALVDTILTPAAAQFITPLSFQSVTGREAYTEASLWGAEAHVLHVGLAHQCNLLAIAPATADMMARLVNGMANDLLSLIALAYGAGTPAKPLLIAPAMDGGMYTHPATQENIRRLRERGATIIGPESGHLASGLVAAGRMTEPAELLGWIRYLLARHGPLEGRRVVVTAGGTQEALDPVRVLTNRSSGKQGYALAQAAVDAGADVTLISTSTALSLPVGVQHIRVESTAEMERAVLKACQSADALLMAAAVADFRPVDVAHQKIKKQEAAPTIRLTKTEDILAAVARLRRQIGQPSVVVGFAAETQDLLENAQAKLQAKNLDLIVANDITAPDAGFEVDTNRVTLLKASGESEALPLQSKAEVAERVLAEVISLLRSPHGLE